MSYPLTVAQQIQIGQISMYLCLNDVTTKKFQQSTPYYDEMLPLILAMETDCVNWQYELNSSDASLFQAGNYLYALCGRYAIQAQAAVNAGGVIVTPTTDVSQYQTLLKNYPQFVVADSGTPITTNGSTLTIVDSNIIPESLLGQVEVHSDGSELGQALSDRQNFTVAYSVGQFVITWLLPIPKGTLIQIKYPVKSTLVYSATPTPPTVQTVYTLTLVGATSGFLVDTNGNIFGITAGTQGELVIRLTGYDTDGNGFAGYWQYYVNNIGGVITLELSTGGLYKSYSGGNVDANTVISGDNTLQGVKITETGFAGKTITYNATFVYTSGAI